MKLSEFAAVLKQIPGTARQPAIAIAALESWQRITKEDGTVICGPNSIIGENGEVNLENLRASLANDKVSKVLGLGKGGESLIREAMFLIDALPMVRPNIDLGLDEEIMEIKRLRGDIDRLLNALSGIGKTQTRERSLVRTKLQEASMWLGMDLKRIGEQNPGKLANPYPNSKNPGNTVIDPSPQFSLNEKA